MEARREARRRKILENSDNRLKRVMEVQSKARKKAFDDETTGKSDGEYLQQTLALTREKEGSYVDANNDSNFQTRKGPCEVETTENDDSMHENDSSEIAFEQRTQVIDNEDDINETTSFQTDVKMQKYVERKQMILRMVIILGLAVLLVAVSNLRAFENTRYGEIRKSSFLPYFITLELILFCLFPVERELEVSSLLNILLTIIGLSEKKVWIFYAITSAARIFQDVIWFTFAVAILHHYAAKS